MRKDATSVRFISLVVVALSLLACSGASQAPITSEIERAIPKEQNRAVDSDEATTHLTDGNVCRVSLAWVTSDMNENYTRTFVARTVPSKREVVEFSDGCVCAYLLVTLADSKISESLSVETVVGRTELRVDDALLEVVAVSEPNYTFEFTSPEGTLITGPEGLGICWYSDKVSSGSHQADLVYTTSSGTHMPYKWEFEVLP